jgi:2-hydroxy-6-oxo-6-(2'-aminophenyl)hexa-2,4-dienoate hydrolase
VILIHGWTQAWNTWRSTIEHFHGQYRMYAPDLWGFGLSDKERRDSFEVADFVELIPQFMDALGIIKMPLMGHSMGGTTALGVALKYPERVKKVAVVGSPIDGRTLSLFLKFASRGQVAKLLLAGENAPLLRTFLRLWSPFVSRQNPNQFYETTIENSSGFTTESFYRSIDSLRRTDLRDELATMQVPAMGIYGARDVIVSPKNMKVFRELVPDGHEAWIPDAGHFPMWDTPDRFFDAFQEFMEI